MAGRREECGKKEVGWRMEGFAQALRRPSPQGPQGPPGAEAPKRLRIGACA